MQKVIRSADLIDYTAEEGIRILSEGKFLVSDSFPGNDRNKLCLSSRVREIMLRTIRHHSMLYFSQANTEKYYISQDTLRRDPCNTAFQLSHKSCCFKDCACIDSWKCSCFEAPNSGDKSFHYTIFQVLKSHEKDWLLSFSWKMWRYSIFLSFLFCSNSGGSSCATYDALLSSCWISKGLAQCYNSEVLGARRFPHNPSSNQLYQVFYTHKITHDTFVFY